MTRPALTTGVLALASVAALGALAGGNGRGEGGAGGEARPPAVQTVVLTARHSRFEPATVEVPVGTTVRFVVRNVDPIDHELIVGDEDTHRRHEAGREAHHHGDTEGEISVPAGTAAVTTYRATAAGPVVFGCHLPGHFAYGMAGVLTVRPA